MGFQIVKLTDPIQFTNVSGGLVPKGAYAAGTDYTVGDSVDYNGSSYVMFADAAAGTLPTDTTKWQVLANKGDTGATGPQGPAGTTDYNELVNLPTLGTAAAKDIPATGDASATEVVYGTDTRLTDSRPASDVSAWAKAPTKPTYTKSEVGLGNVDDTSDANKPVSTAMQTALAGKQDKDATLTALAAHNTNGILTQTAADTFTGRTITGTTNQVTVTNGDGVAGNPTLSLPSAITLPGTLTITGHTSPQADSTYNLGTSSLYWKETYTDKLFLNSTATLDGSTAGEIKGTGIFTADNIKRGVGFPNGVVTANVGTVYIDTAITNGASSWIKKSGTGSTGWQVLEGDTGWRDVSSSVNGFSSGILRVKRKDNTVAVSVVDLDLGTNSGSQFDYYTLPSGFGASQWQFSPLDQSQVYKRSLATGSVLRIYSLVASTKINGGFNFDTNAAWPTTLPGTAA